MSLDPSSSSNPTHHGASSDFITTFAGGITPVPDSFGDISNHPALLAAFGDNRAHSQHTQQQQQHKDVKESEVAAAQSVYDPFADDNAL